MKMRFVRTYVLKIRLTKVRSLSRKRPKPVINERLQALARKIVQEHLEAFKRLAGK